MPKSRQKKEEELSALKEKFDRSKAIVVASQSGVTVKEIEALRADLRKAGSELVAAKKTLVQKLMQERSFELPLEAIVGTPALAFSYEDEISAAKTAYRFSKDHDGFAIVGGLLERTVMSAADMVALATLPSKQELIAKLVGTIRAPLAGFMNVLTGPSRGLVTALDAIQKSK